jgi:hypothetical protein
VPIRPDGNSERQGGNPNSLLREARLERGLSRLFAFLLLLCLTISAGAQDEFRFVRPVHAVQNKRLTQQQPSSSVTTFRSAGSTAVADPPEVTIGERLFMDTRFAQYFAANYDGNVNHPLAKGDPALDSVEVKGKTVRGPFATRSINCRSCHFVAEFAAQGTDDNRTYADFAQRSRVPAREDGKHTTERNSISMVDSFAGRNGATLLHADGEFASAEALVKSTLTGRNFGWLASEHDKAVAHIAKVIRQDDGTDAISIRYGGPYGKILAGVDRDIHPMFRLPKEYTIDVSKATDPQILDAIAKLMGAYLDSLAFARDKDGVFNGSPYDLFLKINGLPAMPNAGETDAQYTERLARAVNDLQDPKWVDENQQTTWFQYHQQKFDFGPQEFAGLKIFLRKQVSTSSPDAKRKPATLLVIPGALVLVGLSSQWSRRATKVWCGMMALGCTIFLGGWTTGSATGSSTVEHVANCTTCHTPPDFTDRQFHNNGASQDEYDAVHGPDQFAKLKIPSYEERNRQHDKFLPATSQHPSASGVFREEPRKDDVAAADLGMWNIYGNPDYLEPQAQMQRLLCKMGTECDPKDLLPETIARFRTPPLRDLEDSSPFMHSGRFKTIEDVLHYYMRLSELARRGEVRNGSSHLAGIMIDEQDVAPLAAFLRSLNEDYD